MPSVCATTCFAYAYCLTASWDAACLDAPEACDLCTSYTHCASYEVALPLSPPPPPIPSPSPVDCTQCQPPPPAGPPPTLSPSPPPLASPSPPPSLSLDLVGDTTAAQSVSTGGEEGAARGRGGGSLEGGAIIAIIVGCMVGVLALVIVVQIAKIACGQMKSEGGETPGAGESVTASNVDVAVTSTEKVEKVDAV